MTRTALVTGATGQDGIYLCRLLQADGVRVVGTVNPAGNGAGRAEAYLDGVDLVPVDIRDASALDNLVRRTEPDEVFHLAAFTSVGQSWNAPEEAMGVNHQAVVDLLESVMAASARIHKQIRFFQASSAELIGDAAASPYARAKQAAAEAVHDARARGLHASTGILFNHESPLRSEAFVTRKITRAAAAIALGRTDRVDLGNLEVVRDWGFAGDFVQAMRAMVRLDDPTDLEIGTGLAHSLEDLLAVAFEAAGLSDPMSYVHQDPALLRPADTSFSGADTAPAAAALDWRATTSFEATVQHMVEVDLRRLRSGVEESADYLDVTGASSAR
ncbi:GDP-mannose 4,6-dehydratase [Nocardioides baekrokdamisoli]|uniref:GDP-mannose 4,6-dehydratase n=1 Tax=Nocardioides baekrokdamisoli TaxID=1804624 RepID=A0A3G9ID75_9ACTN|nr:GDP-mannose 4,6-dehydratase [Nocardioides baekrokdamisoli]BBH16907.1 GDP-mannose 4,6-dehydratase [Nocardioides baekrokdamisoli]